MQDALLQGNVDAALMVQPFKNAAIQDGNFEVIGDVFSEVQPGAVVGNYVATNRFAADNPELIKNSCEACARASAGTMRTGAPTKALQPPLR